ncbi:MAG: flavodoxin family protein [Clostridia bacterium]|nr:flavodoxin family protein [Clostridia bacterium]
MKISIIYYSETDTTKQVAEWIAEGIKSVQGTEVGLFNLKDDEAPDRPFVEASSAVIFGTPTYVANMCWQMKKFFDTHLEYNLAGRIGSAFSTEGSPHGGGGELAIMTLINHMLVKGMLIYSSGSGCGRPFIHIGPTVVRTQIAEREEICNLFGKRIAEKAKELFN